MFKFDSDAALTTQAGIPEGDYRKNEKFFNYKNNLTGRHPRVLNPTKHQAGVGAAKAEGIR